MPQTTTHTEVESFIAALGRGDYDDRLDELNDALTERRERAARIFAAGLSRGDTVHFADNIRPRYLAGLPATVIKVNQQSVNLSVPDDPDYGKFAGGCSMRCPNSLIAELAV